MKDKFKEYLLSVQKYAIENKPETQTYLEESTLNYLLQTIEFTAKHYDEDLTTKGNENV